METDKPTQTETAQGRRPSLEDAVPVQTQQNGTLRTRLQNKTTGEWFYSFCSAHWDYSEDCDTCHHGMWAY